MIVEANKSLMSDVALRKESVDRNARIFAERYGADQSLSARRAWIEIDSGFVYRPAWGGVALRKESVDRNLDTL